MDEMKVNLSGKLMRGIVSKMISKALSKKIGCKVDIQLNALNLEYIDGDVHISTSVDGRMNKTEFMKVLKNIGLDED